MTITCYRCGNILPTSRWWLRDREIQHLPTGKIVPVCGTCFQCISKNNVFYVDWTPVPIFEGV